MRRIYRRIFKKYGRVSRALRSVAKEHHVVPLSAIKSLLAEFELSYTDEQLATLFGTTLEKDDAKDPILSKTKLKALFTPFQLRHEEKANKTGFYDAICFEIARVLSTQKVQVFAFILHVAKFIHRYGVCSAQWM